MAEQAMLQGKRQVRHFLLPLPHAPGHLWGKLGLDGGTRSQARGRGPGGSLAARYCTHFDQQPGCFVFLSNSGKQKNTLSWGHLGPTWGHLGANWGTLGAILNPLEQILEPLGAIMDHLAAGGGCGEARQPFLACHFRGHLGNLGAILGHLGTILGPCRAV